MDNFFAERESVCDDCLNIQTQVSLFDQGLQFIAGAEPGASSVGWQRACVERAVSAHSSVCVCLCVLGMRVGFSVCAERTRTIGIH